MVLFDFEMVLKFVSKVKVRFFFNATIVKKDYYKMFIIYLAFALASLV